jgi:hypothetical protein
MAEQDLDLTMPTRDGELVMLTTARFTREGVAELAISNINQPYLPTATIITAKQARALATAFDKLAAFWGE